MVNSSAVANTLADVTGLAFPVLAGTEYWFSFTIPYTSAATTTGSRFSISGPAATYVRYISRNTLTATAETLNFVQAYDAPAASNATSLTTGNIATVVGVILPSAPGSVQCRFASEVSGSAVTALAGAFVRFMPVP